MNALKYTVVLCAMLMAFGLCTTAPAAAQTAVAQTKVVVPRHLQPLPEVDSAPPASSFGFQLRPQEEKPQADIPKRGMPTPRPIEIMMDSGQFDQAISEFEKYMETAQGDPCDLIYLPYTFYNRLFLTDLSKTAFYQEKMDFYIDEFLETCGHTVEAYLLKEDRMNPKIPDSTVVWMTEAIALDPAFDLPYLIRGSVLWALQRTQEACADFKRAAELQNGDAKEWYEERCGNQ